MTINVGDVVKINVDLLEESGWDYFDQLPDTKNYIKENKDKEYIVALLHMVTNPNDAYNIVLEDEHLNFMCFNHKELILIQNRLN